MIPQKEQTVYERYGRYLLRPHLLSLHQFSKESLLFHQLFIRSILNDLSLIEHKDPVTVTNRGKPESWKACAR